MRRKWEREKVGSLLAEDAPTYTWKWGVPENTLQHWLRCHTPIETCPVFPGDSPIGVYRRAKSVASIPWIESAVRMRPKLIKLLEVDFSSIEFRSANFLIQQNQSFEMALEGCRQLQEKFEESFKMHGYLRWWINQQAAPMEFDPARMQVVLRDGKRVNAHDYWLSGARPQYTRRFQFQMTWAERKAGRKVGEVEMLEDDFDEYELPKHESMRGRHRKRGFYANHVARQRDTKPLKRWLRGQHGRPWDHVWAEAVRRCARWERDEICMMIDKGNEPGAMFYIRPDKTLGYRPPRKSQLDCRAWALEAPPKKDVHVVGDRVFYQIDGFWYEITTRASTPADKDLFGSLVHDVWFFYKLQLYQWRWDGKDWFKWYSSQFATRVVTGKKRLSSFALVELFHSIAMEKVTERDARARPPHNGIRHAKVPKNSQLKSGMDEKKLYEATYRDWVRVFY